MTIEELKHRNQILARVYNLFPSIGAWAKSGRPSPLWDSPQNASHGVSQYVGPTAMALFMDSQHVDETDRVFLRSTEAYQALCSVIDAIYHPPCPRCPHLKDGLFIEPTEGPRAAT